jgi:hypothetical protein
MMRDFCAAPIRNVAATTGDLPNPASKCDVLDADATDHRLSGL